MEGSLTPKAYFVLIGFFCFLPRLYSQDQKIADSLSQVYRQGQFEDTARMALLKQLAFNETRDLRKSLQYAEQLVALAKEVGDDQFLFSGYQLIGGTKRLLGELDEALSAYFQSIRLATKLNYPKGVANSYMAIADVYSTSENHDNAMVYYNKAISTLRKSRDSSLLAAALTNAGGAYLDNEKYDSARLYFTEAAAISENIDYPVGRAYNLGNLGMLYASLDKYGLAEKNINEAIAILEENEVYDPICSYLMAMADIYIDKGEMRKAFDYATRSHQLAQRYGLKDQISEASLKISQLHELAGDRDEAFRYYKQHILYRDSVNDIRSVQKMANLRTDFEVSRKQVEVDLLNEQKRNQRNVLISLSIILALGIILLASLFRYYQIISREKKKSESLLLNILPAETAKELKQKGKVDAVRFDEVTVLFTDFVEFSRLAEKIAPEQLVRSIDFYFREFDQIAGRYGLEKIKTVGDSYMCAAGLPTPSATHAEDVVNAAREMLGLVRKSLGTNDGLDHFDIRIGIHTGPVVAGIVGLKKWQYDIWGDTVNIASRMESNSGPGRINISESTYQKVAGRFSCEYRGEMEVKHRGKMKMYFLIC